MMSNSKPPARLSPYKTASVTAVLLLLATYMATQLATFSFNVDFDPDGRTRVGALLSTLFCAFIAGIVVMVVVSLKVFRSRKGLPLPPWLITGEGKQTGNMITGLIMTLGAGTASLIGGVFLFFVSVVSWTFLMLPAVITDALVGPRENHKT